MRKTWSTYVPTNSSNIIKEKMITNTQESIGSMDHSAPDSLVEILSLSQICCHLFEDHMNVAIRIHGISTLRSLIYMKESGLHHGLLSSVPHASWLWNCPHKCLATGVKALLVQLGISCILWGCLMPGNFLYVTIHTWT